MVPTEPQPELQLSAEVDIEDGRTVYHELHAWLPGDEENGASASVVLTPKIEGGVAGISIHYEHPRKAGPGRKADMWLPVRELNVDGIHEDEDSEVEPAKRVRVIDLNEDGNDPDLGLIFYPRTVEQSPQKPLTAHQIALRAPVPSEEILGVDELGGTTGALSGNPWEKK